jgi:cell division septation protein DedD
VRRGNWRVRVVPGPRAILTVSLRQNDLEKSVVVTGDEPVIVGVDFSLPAIEPELSRDPVLVAGNTSAAPQPDAASAAGGFAVQLGSFSVEANARRLVEQVRGTIPDATMAREGAFWVVRSGRRDRPAANTLARELANRGIEAMVMKSAAASDDSPSSAFVVQLGAFSVVQNAHDLVNRLEQQGVKADLNRRGALYFVQTAPVATHYAAAETSESLRRRGFSGVVREVEVVR